MNIENTRLSNLRIGSTRKLSIFNLEKSMKPDTFCREKKSRVFPSRTLYTKKKTTKIHTTKYKKMKNETKVEITVDMANNPTN